MTQSVIASEQSERGNLEIASATPRNDSDGMVAAGFGLRIPPSPFSSPLRGEGRVRGGLLNFRQFISIIPSSVTLSMFP
ncbi:hypothetical protein ES705_41793 [subsurface metagenome]